MLPVLTVNWVPVNAQSVKLVTTVLKELMHLLLALRVLTHQLDNLHVLNVQPDPTVHFQVHYQSSVMKGLLVHQVLLCALLALLATTALKGVQAQLHVPLELIQQQVHQSVHSALKVIIVKKRNQGLSFARRVYIVRQGLINALSAQLVMLVLRGLILLRSVLLENMRRLDQVPVEYV